MVLSMNRWVGKVAIVTGASSGIGAAIAERLVKEGLQVGAMARREHCLKDLQKKLSNEKGKLVPIKIDITNEEEMLKVFKWIKLNLGPLHILVNNAGVALPKTNLIKGDTEAWRQLYNVNVIGLCIATREAVKDMMANDVDGHIIHICSILGHQVVKPIGLSVYSSSKFAVRALAETLRLELLNRRSKIKITNVSPGLVDTEILRISSFGKSAEFKKILEEKRILDPQDIADGVIYALSTPPHVQIQQVTIRPVCDNW